MIIHGMLCKLSCAGSVIFNVFISSPSIINHEYMYLIPRQPLEHLHLHKQFKKTSATTISSLIQVCIFNTVLQLQRFIKVSANANFPWLNLFINVYVSLLCLRKMPVLSLSTNIKCCQSNPLFKGLCVGVGDCR